jgi:ABC-type multidrug transport system ATPase subunit
MPTFECPTCRTANAPDARYCRACAAQLAPVAPVAMTVQGAPPPVVRSWVVGSSAECDVVVAKSTVSRRHCRLTLAGITWHVEDLDSRNGTWVNGVRISSITAVAPNDRVTLGQGEPLPWPALEPTYRAAPREATGPRTLTIGRAADNDIVLEYPMVSLRHARLVIREGGATIEDLGSTNGTAVGSHDNRIASAPIGPGDVVYFGSFRIPAAKLLAGPAVLGAGSCSVLPFSGSAIVFGRDPSADEVLDFPMISWRHARLTRGADGFVVEDLGSTNGTYVNGVRIASPTTVRPGDVIGLGTYTFRLNVDGSLERRDFRGDVAIEVRDLSVDVPGKRLLGDVSLTIYPSEFVGLMGPSGAGKTTLMNAMNGYTPPTGGAVLVNGLDLYASYERFCGHIGYVPQNDIMHGDLTVGQALYYTARLRLPSDYRAADIRARVREVLGQLGLEAADNVLIGSAEKKGISGGQRKRVNLAMELLTDPSVLFLDEPTSGLSSEDTLLVMRLLRRLADSGKTILLTIHQPSLDAYRLMDNVVVVAKDRGSDEPGRLAYFGPAYPNAVDFFNPDGVEGLRPGQDPAPDEVLRGLAKAPSAAWVQRFAASRYRREFVDDRAGRRPDGAAAHVAPKIARRIGLRQWMTLVRRYVAIKARDTWNTAILLAQAPIIGALIVLVFGEKVRAGVAAGASPVDWMSFSGACATTIFLMAISAIWFGCSNAAREVVGEWAIFHRERMVNLKIPSYVASKLAVLGSLCVVQCAVLLGIVAFGCGLEGDLAVMLAMLVLASFAGLGLGLAVSALARTSEVAIALVPLILIPMVIAGGMMKPVHELSAPMRGFAHVMASRWAFEGMLLAEAEARPAWTPPAATGAAPKAEDLAEAYFPVGDDRFGIAASFGALAAMFGALVLAIVAILKLRDVH